MATNELIAAADVDEFDEIGEEQSIHQEAIDLIITTNLSQNDLTAALLTLFYAGKFTQCALKLMRNFLPPTNDAKIPSSFNALCKEILSWNNEHIKTKKWFCPVCLSSLAKLDKQSQKNFSTCTKR